MICPERPAFFGLCFFVDMDEQLIGQRLQVVASIRFCDEISSIVFTALLPFVDTEVAARSASDANAFAYAHR